MSKTLLPALGLSAFLLVGCASGEHEDLRQWMEENSRDLRGRVEPLPEVKPYEPIPYEVADQVDPFQSSKIEPTSRRGQGGGSGSPDFEARELRNSVLEKYPLESLTMIGRLNVNKQPIAVIKYEDNVRQVKVGDYIGLDFGMVTQITENEVKLRELIQDSAGDWTERQSSLHLQTTEGSSQ
ncbi:pilus assembly protein PilP [Azonexus sp.]|uniref:pilus assembly protein PilP n=1 Tax=Azonexus sp. TaxID=1872668 RepID=UPI0039E3231D